MAHLLGGENLRLEYPTQLVFAGVSVGVSRGDRIGIVGVNGGGKSSLLGLLSGRVEPDLGRVTSRGGVRVGYLSQGDCLDPNGSVRVAVVGDGPEHTWASDPRIRDILAGLLSEVPFDARIGELSGGQRRRVALAALLAGQWDVLMLDEPTNHLDIEGITWLAGHLRSLPASVGVLVVTHDRWFLDEVCNRMWEVHSTVVEPFEGGYAAYVLQRVERDRIAASSAAKQANLMRKELAWLRRGAPARTSKPKFRIDAANKLIESQPPVRDRVELTKMATARLGKDVFELIDAGVSYGQNQVLSGVDWIVGPGDRVGLLGRNGSGKTTLLNLLTGALRPTSGRIKRGKTVRVATLTQELSELTEYANMRVAEVLARYRTTYVSQGRELTPAQLLERLGFKSRQLSARVSELSGGQRRRLQLMLTLLDEPNVLILDEPSNDLDTDMLATMEDLLDTWPGTLVVVSHDRYLLERTTDDVYGIIGGGLRHLPGGVEQYLSLVPGGGGLPGQQFSGENFSGDGGADGGSGDGDGGGAGGAGNAAGGRAEGLSGAQLHAARKELSTVERRVERLRGELGDLHGVMAGHDQGDYEALAALNAKAQALESQIGDLEERWLELEEQIS